jgi:hypothetical protein
MLITAKFGEGCLRSLFKEKLLGNNEEPANLNIMERMRCLVFSFIPIFSRLTVATH